MKNNILVIGGTGKTGRKVAERLTKAGQLVRIGSRTANPAFDWHDPTTWPAAMEGINKVYITFQPDLAVPGAKEIIQNFAELAAQKGVEKLVILSGRGEAEAQACEKIIMNAGTNWSVVRADWFNQNFSESFFLEPIQAGHMALPRGEAKIPFVDTDDIADVAVEALLKDQYNGQVLEVTGPGLLTFSDVVSEIANATGRKITFQDISLEEYVTFMEKNHVPEAFIWLVNYLFTEVLDGRNFSTTDTIARVLGRKPKAFSTYAHETAASGIWSVPVSAAM
ncbi:MAG: NmrA family NAD(P)-binding protein [Bacteroidota bacterium]